VQEDPIKNTIDVGKAETQCHAERHPTFFFSQTEQSLVRSLFTLEASNRTTWEKIL